jgi:phosphopantothenoylcysteine decarboxylase/phosphopantothenate--cysteine ligase
MGPTTVEPPPVREIVRVRRAAEMFAAVMQRADGTDLIVMAAAVADYTPEQWEPRKISKDQETLTLVMKKTPDILAELGRRRRASGSGPLLVGFAAETEDIVNRAAAKRAAKQVDVIVANDVSRADAGFDVDTNQVAIVGTNGAELLPLLSKARVASEILNRVEILLSERLAKISR